MIDIEKVYKERNKKNFFDETRNIEQKPPK
jgi:hypothetical protein